MLPGAIIGDIAGSRFEHNNYRNIHFDIFDAGCHITDDTVCTVTVAEWIAAGGKNDLAAIMQRWCQKYPDAGYGGIFYEWIQATKPKPCNSFGNGSVMRVSPVAWLFDDLEMTLKYAEQSAAITHNHPEGIKGAQAIAAAIWWARSGKNKAYIKKQIENRFACALNDTCDHIRQHHESGATCAATVPLVIIAFLESEDFAHAIHLAVSPGGDSDTIAAMAGSIAEAFYGIPPEMENAALPYLPAEMIAVLRRIPTTRILRHTP
jgi:ADP-ribosylglycohydrolase